MRYLHLKLAGPAIAGMLLLVGGMATIPYLAATRIDRETKTRQEMLVQRNIAVWMSDIEFSLTSWTIWDEAIAKLDNAFDRDWAERNIGLSLTGTSRTRFAAVLTADDTVLYTHADASVATRPFFKRSTAEILVDAAPLIADVRARETLPKGSGIPKPVSMSRIEVFEDDAVLLSVSLFQPDFGTVKPKGDRAPILVTAMPIDTSLQDFFGTRFLLDDAHLSPLSAVGNGRARAQIATGPHGDVQVLSWQPPTPAADVLSQTTPLLMTVCLALLAGGFLLARISQSTARSLVLLQQDMTHAATHDFLTGLNNRALLNETFLSLSKKGELVVACLDLDGFKGVNDTFGHAIGDDLLRVVAARLRADTRGVDRLFRLGGDEFAILMPEMSLHEAERACYRLGQALAAPLYLPADMAIEAGADPAMMRARPAAESAAGEGHRIKIGASFGVVRVEAGMTCDTAFHAADSALYRAKSRGRGSVVLSSGGNAEPEPAVGKTVSGGAGERVRRAG